MILLKNAVIVTSGKEAVGSVLIDGDHIGGVFWQESPDYDFSIFKLTESNPDLEIRELSGKHIIAGDFSTWKAAIVPQLMRRL